MLEVRRRSQGGGFWVLGGVIGGINEFGTYDAEVPVGLQGREG